MLVKHVHPHMLVQGQGVGGAQHEQRAMQINEALLKGDIADAEPVAQHHHQHHQQHHGQGKPGAQMPDAAGEGGQALLPAFQVLQALSGQNGLAGGVRCGAIIRVMGAGVSKTGPPGVPGAVVRVRKESGLCNVAVTYRL